MNSIPRTSGIYKITCTANGKIYVGSAKNLRERWRGHRKLLRRGNHHSIHLQNAWNKYGEPAFTFEVLELVMPWSRIDREQYWLDTLKPWKRKIGFNIAKRAEPFGDPPKYTPERRAKISERHKGNQYVKGRKMSDEERAERSRTANRTFTDEHKVNLSAAKMGHIVTNEAREKMSRAHMQKYIVTDPNGVETEIIGLVKFCKEHGLQRVNMGCVAHGKQSHHRGWKCRLAE